MQDIKSHSIYVILRFKSLFDRCFHVVHRWILKRKLAFQGDGSLLIQELKPDTKSSFLPQITNNPITVKFLTIFYIVVRDTNFIVDQSYLNQSSSILLYISKKRCEEKIFLLNACNIKPVFFLGILQEREWV